eukprot:TRINITY_DN4274_c0_g1_i2.p1 TRINITY_DN4274_c0_g1~~TRINITY_DN4274_c0_g1_i2.p1  ORF type:complete len:215 (+),score=60.19 TRINITY_DN4274_c0_g1_i2:144-788(+)
MNQEAAAAWKAAAQHAADSGAEVVPVSLPSTESALATYYVIAAAEASSNLARYDGVHFGELGPGAEEDVYTDTRSHLLGEEVQRRIMVGTFVLSSERYSDYLDKAHRVRRLIFEEYESVFEQVDGLIVPGALGPAPRLDAVAEMKVVDHYANDVMNIATNLAGLAAICVPVGMSKQGLPLAVQVLAKRFDEQTVLNVGAQLMQRGDFVGFGSDG